MTISSSLAGISFVTATTTLSENSGVVSLSVQRLYNTNSAVSVQYFTVNGTARATTNYTYTSGTLTFTNGEVLKSVSIPLIDDTNVTGDLKFSVGLTNPVGAQLLSPSNSVVVLQDADAGLSFSTSTQSVLKNAGFATISVINSGGSCKSTSITTTASP